MSNSVTLKNLRSYVSTFLRWKWPLCKRSLTPLFFYSVQINRFRFLEINLQKMHLEFQTKTGHFDKKIFLIALFNVRQNYTCFVSSDPICFSSPSFLLSLSVIEKRWYVYPLITTTHLRSSKGYIFFFSQKVISAQIYSHHEKI